LQSSYFGQLRAPVVKPFKGKADLTTIVTQFKQRQTQVVIEREDSSIKTKLTVCQFVFFILFLPTTFVVLFTFRFKLLDEFQRLKFKHSLRDFRGHTRNTGAWCDGQDFIIRSGVWSIFCCHGDCSGGSPAVL